MTHPSPEELVEFAYNELSPDRFESVQKHLTSCVECRARFESLGGAMAALDGWKLPARVPYSAKLSPGWKWAAAAVLALTTAFAAGRMSGPSVDIQSLARAVEHPIRESLRQEIAAQLLASSEEIKTSLAGQIEKASARTLASAQISSAQHLEKLNVSLASIREEDRKGVVSLLQEIDQNHKQGLLILRNDLETLAVQAEASFRNAQRQLVQLAGNKEGTLQN